MLQHFGQPFLQYRFLLSQLIQREIKARYKQSFIGYAWVLINPLAQLLVYTFVVAVVFRFRATEVPYPLFLLAGLLPWTFLQSSLTASAVSLVDNSSLLRKVAFPRETIPYAVVAAKLLDFLFAALIFVVLFAVFQQPLRWEMLLVVPLLLLQVLLVSGLSLFLSAANLFYRDFQFLANLILTIWFYLTPIVYPTSLVPAWLQPWYQLNPLVGVMEGYRFALFGQPVEAFAVLWSVFSILALYILSWSFFKRSEKLFSDMV